MNEEPKPIFKSKTAIVNLLIIIAPFIPGVEEWIKENPNLILHAIGLIGIILRMVTKGRVKLFGQGNALSVLLFFLALSFLFLRVT